MPWLLWTLGITAATSLGAFIGSQVDDAVETPQVVSTRTEPNWGRILLYAGGAAAVLYVGRKAIGIDKIKF